MWQKIKCFFGFHEWEDITHPDWIYELKVSRCVHCHKVIKEPRYEDPDCI